MTAAQKVIKYLALAFAVFLIISIITGICGALYYVSYFFSGNTAEEMTEHIIGSGITSLKVDISAAELEIKTGEKFGIETNNRYLAYNQNGETLEIKETNHRYLTYKENGEILEVNEARPSFVSRGGMKVILTLPEGVVFDYADINAGAGNVTINELRASSLKINLGAGELKAGRLDASDKAEIDGGAGSVTISGGRLNNADIDMGIGELNLTGELDGKCSIDYGIGETNLVLTGNDNDYKIKLDKGVGEARLDGKKMNDDSVYGGGSRYIEIDGGIGELNIFFTENSGGSMM